MTLTSVSPISGPISGGTLLTLSGLFTPTDSFTVFIGGAACSNVTIVNNTTITCITSASLLSPGPQALTLTDTTSHAIATLQYCYLSPGDACLGDLILQAQQRANMENSDFVSQSEWITYINNSYFELYDILVQKFGNEYFVAAPAGFQTDGINQQYALPNGVLQFINSSTNTPFTAPALYKLLRVELSINGAIGSWVTLKRYNFTEGNKYTYPNFQNYYGAINVQYHPVGNTIMFIPIPDGFQFIQLWYIPRLIPLVNNTDLASGVSGWLDYVVVDAAIKALVKEESDPQALMLQKQALLLRIESAAENRDAGLPQTVTDVTRLNGYGYNGLSGGDGWGDVY